MLDLRIIADGYGVTPDGEVVSSRQRYWRILRYAFDSSGYKQVSLRIAGRSEMRTIHRLVLEGFVGPRPPGFEARHLDGNKLNNRLDNLCWGSRAENTLDRVQHGLTALTVQGIGEVRRLTRSGWTQRRIAAHIGVSQGCVARICSGRTFSWLS